MSKETSLKVFGIFVLSLAVVAYLFLCVYAYTFQRENVKPDPVIDEILCITQVAAKGEPITFSAELRGEWKIVRTVEGQMLLVEDCK
jgi:hypothetical protein